MWFGLYALTVLRRDRNGGTGVRKFVPIHDMTSLVLLQDLSAFITMIGIVRLTTS